MYLSKLYIKTLKDAPAECETRGGSYLIRGSFIKKSAAGLYSFLPLGNLVLSNIEKIIKEEMNNAGAQEIRLPLLQPRKIWDESGRYQKMLGITARVIDNQKHEFIISPTAEEMIVDLIRNEQFSYRDLPFNLYQVETKVRDEIRPRLTLIRAKEFIMKDAYSFHCDEQDANKEFANMKNTYRRIFNKLEVNFKEVDAETGDMGGSQSTEFQMLADCGEDYLVYCNNCHYGANLEKASSVLKQEQGSANFAKVFTPNIKSIDDVANFFNVEHSKIVKSLVYQNEKEIFILLIRGDLKVDNNKFAKYFDNATAVSDFTSLNIIPGFVGPYQSNLKIFADESVKNIDYFICGANEKDYHFTGVNIKDINIHQFVDLHQIEPGEGCPNCGAALDITRGIEIGHTFVLGDKYSKSLNLTFRDKDGKDKNVIMGCYGIGVSRMLQAIAEQKSDDVGIVWPINVAPFKVCIIPGKELLAAQQIGDLLKEAGISYVIDDRDARLGFKLKDAELIGYPIRLITNPKCGDQFIEVFQRASKTSQNVLCEEVMNLIKKIINY